jgi:hippurate hydrolase
MVKDGMMERFGIEEVYGMHNLPGLPVGQFATRKGPIMAATDEFTVTIKGRGGHAAQPHRTIDPIAIGAQVVANLQMIASRSTDPLRSVVVSVTKFNAGFAHNVIPNEATLAGTIRTLDAEIRTLAETRLRQVVDGLVAAHGAEADIGFHRNYPVTFNHATETEHAVAVASDIAGEANVNPDVDPMMGGEDFSYMLNARPGAFIFIGNGDTAGLHNPAYDFNDEAIAHGISYWVRLAERRLGD